MRWTPRVLGFALVTSLACTCGRPDVIPPERGAAHTEPLPIPRSTVTVPVTLTTRLLETRILEQIPETLIDEKKMKLDHGVVADIHAERSGAPTVRTGSGLRIDIPIRFEVSPRPGKLPSLKLGTVTGELKVTVRLRPDIDDQWNLNPDPELSYTWLKEPVLKVGPLKVGVRSVADRGLDQRLTEIERELRRTLPKTIGLRAKVRDAWTQLGQPRSIRDSPPTWVHFEPQALFADPIASAKNGLQLTVGAAGTLAVQVGDAPTTSQRPLPDRARAPKEEGARIAASLRLPWAEIRRGLADAARGQATQQSVPGLGRVRVAITEVLDVYPSDESIALGLRAQATAAGTTTEVELWLSGRPVLTGDTLRIADLYHVARTASPWFDTIHAAVADDLEALVADKLIIDLAERRQALVQQLDTDLSGRPTRDGITLEADITDARLKRVYPTDTALVVDAVVRGTVAVVIHHLPPP